MPTDSIPLNALLIKLEGLRKEQKWTPETLRGLIGFIRRADDQEDKAESNKDLARAHDLMGKAVAAYKLIKSVPPDLASRLTALQYELMGQKPPELSWSQWRTWNLAPFFSGPSKWHACEFFLQKVVAETQRASAGAMKTEHSRMKRKYGAKHDSLPLDSQVALLLDRKNTRHNERSRIQIITNRSAHPRLQLALRRNSRG
ncbi:MAG TPA: hypothetical protein PK614_02880 [Nitrospira sp.]|nr:hypothetical protein [Nitrospira sp.]